VGALEAIPPRAHAALLEQLARRRETLTAGARHVGWKLGVGERERIDGSIVVGHLTTVTTLGSGDAYRSGGLATELRVDAEIAVELDTDVRADADVDAAHAAIARFAVALEVVDLGPVLGDPVAIVATNVFHRAVAFGPMKDSLPEPPVRASLRVNGAVRAEDDADTDLAGRLVAAARLLSAVGEQLRAGDRVITGSIVQVPIAEGDTVEAEVAGLGAVELEISQ
jgi:2-keto-4-pentenoate hydratase